MQTQLSPFHLAIPVHDLAIARNFYSNILELEEGRSSESWVDYNFFGHQLVIHKSDSLPAKNDHNSVDGHAVPIPHFGIVLPYSTFDDFANSISEKGIHFIIKPYIRFEGLVGEQKTMFFYDPSGNALEFKAFKNMSQLFAK